MWCSSDRDSSIDPRLFFSSGTSSTTMSSSGSTGSPDDPAFAGNDTGSSAAGNAMLYPLYPFGGRGSPSNRSSWAASSETEAQDARANNTSDQRSPLSFPEEWVCRPLNTHAWSRKCNGRLVPVIRSLPPTYSPSPIAIDGQPSRLLSVWGS